MGKPKKETQPTNGPYAWGNGPKPTWRGSFAASWIKRVFKKGK